MASVADILEPLAANTMTISEDCPLKAEYLLGASTVKPPTRASLRFNVSSEADTVREGASIAAGL